MRFISICAPSYAHSQGAPSEVMEGYWRILGLVLAVHCLTIILFKFDPIVKKPTIEDEIIINLSPPIAFPETIPEKVKVDRLEKKQPTETPVVPIARLVPIPPLPTEPLPVQPPSFVPAPVQQVQLPQFVDITPAAKVNETVPKPLKLEQVQDKPVQAISAEKIEEKKNPDPMPPKVQAPSQSPAPSQEEVTAKLLPVWVDKKNKDNDAPQVAPTHDSAKAGAVVATSSSPSPSPSPSPSSASVAGPPQAIGPATSANTPNTEMQAQMAPSKSVALGAPGGNAANADADYKSESLKNAQPRYPMYSRKMRQEGVVIVSAEVLTDGSANEVRVAASSGIKLLDEAALEAVKQWKFTPAKRDGVAYAQRLRIPVTFSLNSR